MTLPIAFPRAAAPSRAQRSELTRDLLAKLHADPTHGEREELIDLLVRLNLRIATAIAARYRGRGVDQDDLQQAASHGLVKAVLQFDATQGNDFLTYAVPTIRGEVQRYFRDASWTVRPPRRVQELQWRLNRTIDRLAVELGREPSEDELLSALDVTYADYSEAVMAFGCFQPASVDRPMSDLDGLTARDVLAEPATPLEAAEARVVLGPLLSCLSDDERRILHLRFVEEHTQQQIGEEYGVAQMQVSRWLARILGRLREELESGASEDSREMASRTPA